MVRKYVLNGIYVLHIHNVVFVYKGWAILFGLLNIFYNQEIQAN